MWSPSLRRRIAVVLVALQYILLPAYASIPPSAAAVAAVSFTNHTNPAPAVHLRRRRPYGRVAARAHNADAAFRGHQKTREERWHIAFRTEGDAERTENARNLVQLLNRVVGRYMTRCVIVVLYDHYVEQVEGYILRTFFQQLNSPYMHGKINANYTLADGRLLNATGDTTAQQSAASASADVTCRHYVLFLADVLRAREVLGPQIRSRVIIVPRSSQWKQQEFLRARASSDIVNLLIVGESLSMTVKQRERPYVLYTHRLFTDGLGSNEPRVLTSWIRGQLSRPTVNLFPGKFRGGFATHRFIVSAAHQPPFVIKRLLTDATGTVQVQWDGLEVRLMRLLAMRLNFTFEIVEPRAVNARGPTFGVIDDVRSGRADFGMAGAYVTQDRLALAEMSQQHSKDCAAFITLASKALPRYRAIMGPFQWPVWLAIIATYLLAIFPLAFSDRLTLRHLMGNWSEVENMFWYVFGTFTNSLTFGGEFSWSSTKRSSTRLLIGFYWVFTIIITACYTSSIIAFVTLPVFPETVDTIVDLLRGYYRFGTLFHDGWQSWFVNSTHPETQRLMKDLELVADVQEGLNNVTKAFFWPYAFLGSRLQLEYLVEGNFTQTSLSRSTALHIGDECLSIYGVSLLMPAHSVYAVRINNMIARLQQSGLIAKLFSELQAELLREKRMRTGLATGLLRAPTAKQLRVDDAEERGLTVADTEGMFLLMGCGYGVALALLLSEMVGGFTNRCRRLGRLRREQRDQKEAAEEEAQRELDREMAVLEMGNGGEGKTKVANGGGSNNGDDDGGIATIMRCSSTGQRQRRRLRNNSLATISAIGCSPPRHHSLGGGADIEAVMRMAKVPTFQLDRAVMDDVVNGGSGAGGADVVAVPLRRAPTPYAHFDDGFGEKVRHDDDEDDNNDDHRL